MDIKKIIGKNKANIEYMLTLTKAFLEGHMTDIDFKLDFSYEIDLRYRKMVKEDDYLADVIYFYIYEEGIDKHYDDTDDSLFQVIEENFHEILNICLGQ
ncbi:MAG: hypothetical protein K9L64_06920 [Candidatus Izimaplasma sp.]|nr:hypothetical protein [Candidatus Izimaplasma bacterium]